MLEREFINKLCASLAGTTLTGKDVVAAHLLRAADKIEAARRETKVGEPPERQGWRDAVTEVRCAMEEQFESIAKEACAARRSSLEAQLAATPGDTSV